jgi:hypothetical protein
MIRIYRVHRESPQSGTKCNADKINQGDQIGRIFALFADFLAKDHVLAIYVLRKYLVALHSQKPFLDNDKIQPGN